MQKPGKCVTPVLAAAMSADCTQHTSDWRSAPLSVAMTNDDGEAVRLVGRVCRPSTDAEAPVVVINHGSPPSARKRPFETMADCEDEAPAWFLSRGFVVVQMLRRGYGDSGGAWAEDYGHCLNADFRSAGLATARDIDAAVKAAAALPYVDPSQIVVLGQSAGAWGTLAYSSLDPPGIAAFIAMAPGRGGHRDGMANENCSPDRLVEAAGTYGRTSRAGVLWVSASNDSYFAPEFVLRMQGAFAAAGGKMRAVHLGPYDDDGHHLFFGKGGSAIWGPVVATYLAERHVAIAPTEHQ